MQIWRTPRSAPGKSCMKVRRSWTSLLRLSSPQRWTGKLKKNLFLSCGRFHSLLVNFRNSKTSRHSEIKQTRLFRGSILKTKHRGLTNLTFMELVPGADRVVRHICVRCMLRQRTKEKILPVEPFHKCLMCSPNLSSQWELSAQSWNIVLVWTDFSKWLTFSLPLVNLSTLPTG